MLDYLPDCESHVSTTEAVLNFSDIEPLFCPVLTP